MGASRSRTPGIPSRTAPRRGSTGGKMIDLGPLCPDPSMNILMADGSQKKAGNLVVGDLVKTHHEESFELGNYEVEHVDTINDVEKIKLTFDKSTIICSLSHKFYVGGSWKEAKDMVIGDEVSGKKLISIESVEDGDVVLITIKDAHTYICEGLLSHNKVPSTGPDVRGGRGGRPLVVTQKVPRRGRRSGSKRRRGGPDPRAINIRRPIRKPQSGRTPEERRANLEAFDRLSQEEKDRLTQNTRGRGRPVGRRMPPRPKPETYSADLGPQPEREVPIPKETRQPITRESDPRGDAPFSPDEKAMARDRFFERMFDRADERRQQRDMEREDKIETRRSMRDERRARRNEPGEIDIDAERGGRGRKRRRGGIRRNRRGRRRDFTRRRSEMEGGRRGRSREERAAFRDRYVSTLR